MQTRPKQPSSEEIESLKELISTEKARLRWRLERGGDEPPEPGRRTTGKLYRVFSTCLGE